MGMKVFSIERNQEIHERTQQCFDNMGLRAVIRCSDGTLGWEEYAPYEGIVVTAGSPSIPQQFKKQLKIGGRLVIPVGDRRSQKLNILTKVGEDEFSVEEISSFVFVPLIGKDGWKEGQL